MKDPFAEAHVHLKLYVQAALLGLVTPDLRMVTTRFDEQGAHARFVYEAEVSEDAREDVSIAETEVIADYGGLTPVNFSIEILPAPETLSVLAGELTVYRRWEASTSWHGQDEPWLRIRVIADHDSPFTVMFEPTGMTYDLAGGEEMIADVEQPAQKEMQVVSLKGGISILPPGSVVTRDADGNELHWLN